jgi:hypothetical protein
MGDRKDKQVKFWSEPSQYRRWEKASELSKRTFSDWARIVLDEAAERAIAEAEDAAKAKGKKPSK